MRRCFLLAILFCLGLQACVGATGEIPSLKLVADAPLGPASRRLDYASLDSATGLLFVADLAGGHVLVFDTRLGRLIKSIDGLPRVHGVLAVPELGRVYASATGRDELDVIDEIALSVISTVPAGHYPDGIAWAPNARRLFVSDEHGDTLAAIDPSTNRLIDLIPIGGDVGNTQFDAGSGLIYAGDQTHDELVGVDPRSDKVVSRDRLSGCKGAHGLLIDAAKRLAFVACEDNAALTVFSLAAHRQLAMTPVGKDPDVLAYDAGQGRLYVASETGVVSVFEVTDAGVRPIARRFLADNAHVVAVDPASHRVFFPLKESRGEAVLRIMAPK